MITTPTPSTEPGQAPIRRDWTPEPTDDVPDEPALAYTNEHTY